jgi:hypothetical protein
VRKVSAQLKNQQDFCKAIQHEKQAKEVDDLKARLKKAENGINRRANKWKQLPWWQKFGAVTAIAVFLLRDEIQQLTRYIFEMLTGTSLGE